MCCCSDGVLGNGDTHQNCRKIPQTVTEEENIFLAKAGNCAKGVWAPSITT